MFDLPPYRGKWPEVWIAAHGPRMLRATGRYADAWFPVLAIQPKSYAASLQKVRDAAADCGRDPLSITAATGLFVVTGRTRAEVDEALDSEIMKSFALNLPAEVWARHGASHPLGEDFTGTARHHSANARRSDRAVVCVRRAGVAAAGDLLVGTPDEVIDQAAEWRDHGLQYLVVCNISALQPSLRRALAASAPFMKILSPTSQTVTTRHGRGEQGHPMGGTAKRVVHLPMRSWAGSTVAADSLWWRLTIRPTSQTPQANSRSSRITRFLRARHRPVSAVASAGRRLPGIDQLNGG